MGAIAFQKDLGAVHSCAHALGTVADLHHGLANALMIDTRAALERRRRAGEVRRAGACRAASSGGGAGFIAWLAELKQSIGIAAGPRRRHGVDARADRRGWSTSPSTTSATRPTRGRCTAADFERLFERGDVSMTAAASRARRSASRRASSTPIRARPIFKGKTLQYVEQSMAHWVMSSGALAVMIPSPAGDTRRATSRSPTMRSWLDGLLLHGGADVWPGSYGEKPLRPEWDGRPDPRRVRDGAACARSRAGKPVLGICRGLQMINVALRRHALPGHRHPACPAPSRAPRRASSTTATSTGRLRPARGSSRLYRRRAARARVNSVHHQAVKDLAPGFVVEAVSPDDGMVEAIRRPGGSYMAAVQWHPEFHRRGDGTLDDAPMLRRLPRRRARARRSQPHDHALKITNPATGALIAELPADDAAASPPRRARARAAQPAWAATPLAERAGRIARFRAARRSATSRRWPRP